MDTQHPNPPLRLDRSRRNALWSLAASDLDGLGDALNIGGRTRDLSAAHDDADTVRAIFSLLDAIGWDLEDARETYALDRDEDLAALLHRWRGQLDDSLRNEGNGPFSDGGVDLITVRADLDSRLAVDSLLAELGR